MDTKQECLLTSPGEGNVSTIQADQKRPSVPRLAGFPSFFPVSSTGQACCSVHLSTPLADSPTRRRGKMSLLIRRDATLRISGALVNGISQTQLASACLREAASAKAGAFWVSLKKMTFSTGSIGRIPERRSGSR